MEKASDAFRTISEVAEDLDLPQHVLRFWETKFTQIRPMKRGGGRRYYRPDDVELLRGIQYLLYGEGYTIKGVQRILKEQGIRFVMDIWHNPGAPIPLDRPTAAEVEEDAGSEMETPLVGNDEAMDADEVYAPPPEPPMAPRPTARLQEPRADRSAPAPFMAAAVAKAAQAQPSEDDVLPAGILPEGAPARGGFKFMDRFRGASSDHAAGHATPGGALSREDIRRLQSTLFELLECKRLLDQTR